jgi:hypothetical protein
LLRKKNAAGQHQVVLTGDVERIGCRDGKSYATGFYSGKSKLGLNHAEIEVVVVVGAAIPHQQRPYMARGFGNLKRVENLALSFTTAQV